VRLNYFVTGVCGFIASRVAELLLDQDHQVFGLDNLNDAYDPRLKEWRLNRLLGRSGFTFRRGDICDRKAVASLLDTVPAVDAVINLAARAGVRQSIENPWVYLDTNVGGTLNLLEAVRERGIPKFVLASTSSLYGAHNTVPYSETAETSRPLSPYAASKKAAETLCHTYHYLYKIDVSVLRYFTVYGPAGRPDMSMFRFVHWIREGRPVVILGDGKQSRDFTYVDDIARGTVAALKPAGYSVFNLGSDRPAMLMDVVKIIERFLGKSARLEFKESHPADVRETWADITRARRLLEWKPTVYLEEGIARIVEWYEQNRSWARDVDTT
jgi:UDP-glucuronate 4-epimerase